MAKNKTLDDLRENCHVDRFSKLSVRFIFNETFSIREYNNKHSQLIMRCNTGM